jgi:phage gp46-like protein
MTETTYTGDLDLQINGEGDWDIVYENGQPKMTDGFSTCVTLAIFGDPDFWQNELTNDPAEKYISEFPEVVRVGRVNNATINNGVAAIKKALQFMIDSGMAKTINVTGSLLTVYAIQWTIDIQRDETSVRYRVNWDKGLISATTNTNS